MRRPTFYVEGWAAILVYGLLVLGVIGGAEDAIIFIARHIK
jgi:hypothetical protein